MTSGEPPLVSIVTPAFKVERFIGETVASVRAQTWTSFEMILVDDCSPDGTAEAARRGGEGDARVRVIRHDQNRGPAEARNTALREAKGRYIAFLDGDDLWLPDKLERQLGYMDEHEAVLSYTQYRRISEEGELISPVIQVPERLDYPGLLKNTGIATSTVIVDRSKSGPFQMIQSYCDDYVCWLRILKGGAVAHGLQEDLTRYRVLPKSWSRNKLRNASHVWKTFREVEKLGVPYSSWCFGHYVWNAMKKYSR